MKEITNQRMLWRIIDKYLDAHTEIRDKYITRSMYKDKFCPLCLLDVRNRLGMGKCDCCTYGIYLGCRDKIDKYLPSLPCDSNIINIPIQYLKIIYHNEMIFYLCSIKFHVNSLKEFIEKAKVRSNKIFDELDKQFRY